MDRYCKSCGATLPQKITTAYHKCEFCGAPFEGVDCLTETSLKAVSGFSQPDISSMQEPVGTKYVVTIFKDNQFFLIDPAVQIRINGQQYPSVETGKTISVELEQGTYEFIFASSIRKRKVHVSLNGDTRIVLRWNRITGTLEAMVYQ